MKRNYSTTASTAAVTQTDVTWVHHIGLACWLENNNNIVGLSTDADSGEEGKDGSKERKDGSKEGKDGSKEGKDGSKERKDGSKERIDGNKKSKDSRKKRMDGSKEGNDGNKKRKDGSKGPDDVEKDGGGHDTQEGDSSDGRQEALLCPGCGDASDNGITTLACDICDQRCHVECAVGSFGVAFGRSTVRPEWICRRCTPRIDWQATQAVLGNSRPVPDDVVAEASRDRTRKATRAEKPPMVGSSNLTAGNSMSTIRKGSRVPRSESRRSPPKRARVVAVAGDDPSPPGDLVFVAGRSGLRFCRSKSAQPRVVGIGPAKRARSRASGDEEAEKLVSKKIRVRRRLTDEFGEEEEDNDHHGGEKGGENLKQDSELLRTVGDSSPAHCPGEEKEDLDHGGEKGEENPEQDSELQLTLEDSSPAHSSGGEKEYLDHGGEKGDEEQDSELQLNLEDSSPAQSPGNEMEKKLKKAAGVRQY